MATRSTSGTLRWPQGCTSRCSACRASRGSLSGSWARRGVASSGTGATLSRTPTRSASVPSTLWGWGPGSSGSR
eukprot:12583618-Alexandrium_andersonii.AAC.1